MLVDRKGGTQEAEATFRVQLEIVRMIRQQTISGVCCSRCMLYSVYAELGACFSWFMLHSVYASLSINSR